ncbi:MAG: helix-turn-helix transcriptional regulator [Spirochaetaceae bacterium]|nr:helix-turn-helix transcriptional regulator [Spirochaetaceae bacterium]
MSFTSGSTLLDTVVLAVVSREGTYGYKITQDVRNVIDISESTLYPVLRRLQKEGMLETYDVEVDGRNRRYYKITSIGMIKLDEERSNWKKYVEQINFVLSGNKKI